MAKGTPGANSGGNLILHTKELARSIRMRSLRMVHKARMGHPGGDLSAADILAVLYGAVLRVDPQRPDDPARDRFIMSKGHSSGCYYVALAERGFFPREWLDEYMLPLSPLCGHPDRNKVPGVDATTGSLGHGLPVAVGTALAAKLKGAGWRTFVLTGDGELQEGSNWEAAMAASQFQLDNLVLIVDRNFLQQGGGTETTMRLEPLRKKFEAFGWSVEEVDGHDHAALLTVFGRVPFEKGRPNCVLARTVKGKGVSFMQNRAHWHHKVPSAEELSKALQELEAADE